MSYHIVPTVWHLKYRSLDSFFFSNGSSRCMMYSVAARNDRNFSCNIFGLFFRIFCWCSINSSSCVISTIASIKGWLSVKFKYCLTWAAIPVAELGGLNPPEIPFKYSWNSLISNFMYCIPKAWCTVDIENLQYSLVSWCIPIKYNTVCKLKESIILYKHTLTDWTVTIIMQMGNMAYRNTTEYTYLTIKWCFPFLQNIYIYGHGLDKTPLLFYWWYNVTSFVWRKLVLSSDSATAYS